ncbi:protein PLASTID MOVEMENT IMPAIRED 1-RELATED 1-like [Neltuma alba]|uniref:protein PLASTID MOVEMENT IMPAIRED 1-RELATED 1-like n=1 Tax=Neltuma alba TaxID=207710 RepID=UPI0010A3F7F6|nr:protein PLASTID MOVEMENT IMPAIRED 1-RELATED 1-like [Prosopis alba]XP_028753552.1 protein PLASTID MOVEMENT IMPAIRED 1-RELATED 1-like [Prosopis alba]XP_028753553.1 protein PLASTID MOVEMENT IMPAIRED 1-RELATED 1-like [Prosopis alba]
MMLSKVEARKKTGESSRDGKLLKEIETISKALYLDKKFPRKTVSSANSRSKSAGKSHLPDPRSNPAASNEDPSRKDKKSIWNWRPLKAFSHIRNRRFDCSFSLQVHLIEKLPSTFNDASLSVYWKRRDGVLVTRPAKVVEGVAEFEEKLTYTCSVYGSRSGPHHSAKYEAKHFLLYACILSAPELDLGKHRVDLTRLLPLTLEELEEEKNSGKWTTSFRLSGVARGAVMNVSFGYEVVGDNSNATKDNHTVPNALTSRRVGSVPSFAKQYSPRTIDEVKDLHEVLPTSKSALASSIDILYQKFDEEKTNAPVHDKPELDLCSENLEESKPNESHLTDSGKEKSEECVGNDEKCSPVPGNPEISVFQENLEPVHSDGDGDVNENPEECQGRFSVVDQGIESSSNERLNLEASTTKAPDSDVDTHDIAGIQLSSEHAIKCDSLGEENDDSKEKFTPNKFTSEDDDFITKELLMQELESALNSISDLETAALESPKDEAYVETRSEYKMKKSHSLDDITESVASEFLSMIGADHSPFGLSSESESESPRERLLRQFEKEALAEGFSLFDFEMGDDEVEVDYNAPVGSEQWNFSEGCRSSSPFQDLLQEVHPTETQDVRSKQRAQMVEDLETEALMREWGLNEDAFKNSPPKDPTGFGSPIHSSPEEPLTLPPLAEGLGPFLQTKDGGFLRTMDPSLFRNAKSGGSLIMQVSNPVVVPAEMGSGVTEILQRLASLGIEKLSMQANKLMPLEDITGKTMQQVAWEAMPLLEGTERQCLSQHDLVAGQDTSSAQRGSKGTSSGPKTAKSNTSSLGNQTSSEFASLEDLAPLAMDKIEALSMEGLRIQSGMSDQDAPSNIIAQSIGDVSALQGRGADISGSLGLDGAAGLQLLDLKDSSDGVESVDGIMGLSLTLDEWMRLDSGDIDDIENISDHTSKLLAAHHANSFDFIRGTSKGEKKRGKGHGRKCGLLGNNFTVALMVQLRDPLRDYEPVGTPMLALIQVERVFVPPKPRIYCNVSEIRNNNDEDDERETSAKLESKDDKEEEKISEEEGIPQFKITEVHVAGLSTEPEPRKKKLWGTSTNEKSGSRWLLANGMGKSNKHPIMKSKVASKSGAFSTTKVQPGDTLWSISSRVYGSGSKWKELAAVNPHIRNPNVIISDKTIRLK